MLRAEQPPPEEIPEAERPVYDELVARFKRSRADRPAEIRHEHDAGDYHGSLLNSPPFADMLAKFGTLVRTRGETAGGYSHADREWVDQVLMFDWDWYGVMWTHMPDALAVGVRLEAIEALRDGREEDLTDEERQLALYIRQVVSGTVTDESFDWLRDRLGQRGAVEYTVFIGFLLMTLRLHQALGVPAMPREQVEQWIDEFRSGARAVPDPQHRFG